MICMEAIPSYSSSSLRWLYLDLNSYFASVEQQLTPELRGKPVAVVPVITDTTCAIAASYEAKAFGVKTGTMIYEAKRLCPGLICVPAKHEIYVEYHHRILEEIDRHLCIDVVASIDEVACLLTGRWQNEAYILNVAHRIKQGIAARVGEHIRCSIGIAPNRYLAKVATNLQKPDGLVVLHSGDLPERLFVLALQDLPGIGHGMLNRLNAAGIYDIKTLWALPPKQMRALWGSVCGERFWYMLHGANIAETPTQRRTIGHSHVMAPEWRAPHQARIVTQRLLLKAASRLRRMEFYATTLELHLCTEKGLRCQAQKKFPRACDNIALLRHLNVLWEQTKEQTGGIRIKKVAVTLSGLVPCKEAQADLFESITARRRLEKLSCAMDKLNARFGRDAIVIGFLPRRASALSGSKIAFTRIPDYQEFHE